MSAWVCFPLFVRKNITSMLAVGWLTTANMKSGEKIKAKRRKHRIFSRLYWSFSWTQNGDERTNEGETTETSSGPDWPRWRCWRKTNRPQTKDSCMKTWRHFLFGNVIIIIIIIVLWSFQCSSSLFFSSKNTSGFSRKSSFSSSNSTNYKVKPSGVKVRLVFSSKFKINLILGPPMKNQHDKTSSFMIVSKSSQTSICDRNRQRSWWVTGGITRLWFDQVIDELLFDEKKRFF